VRYELGRRRIDPATKSETIAGRRMSLREWGDALSLAAHNRRQGPEGPGRRSQQMSWTTRDDPALICLREEQERLTRLEEGRKRNKDTFE
jgi:hypothetical protein